MCRAEGMGIVPWGVLGQGKFKTEADTPQTAEERSVSAALEKVANEVGNGVSLGAVAIAWALQKSTYAFPIVGGRNAQQLEEVLKALNIVLTPEQIKSLEGAAPFVFGFPYLPLFGTDPALGDGRGNFFVSSVGTVKFVKAPARSSLVLERTSRLLAYAMYQCGFAALYAPTWITSAKNEIQSPIATY
ncbi:NADP-dependent oxidoreductase domain-containing protein [Dichomitus squalens]|uniref:NADP-dependent oxidoreductase domain-containing protein n=1 Tax=Dichomitus squalens TaxID=114155 RepID=A0A4Q9Q7B9_9APHY|nr:NADP-dependent oxidoreductase domain-containing protein [Dichomitus squalens]